MTYEYEQIGEFMREYLVPISQETLDERVRELTSEVASTAHLKGFRKGHTPREVISQRYGGAIKNDVVEKVVEENCREILSDEGLRVGWMARPYQVAADDELAFKVRVETLPEIELGDLSEISITRPIVRISNDYVEDRVRTVREQCIDWCELKGEDVKAKLGDRVWLQLEAFDESELDESQDADAIRDLSPVMLRSPASEIAEGLHAKLDGTAINERVVISHAELRDVFNLPVFLSPKERTAVVSRVDIGELPLVSPNLVSDYRYFHLLVGDRETPIESLEDLHQVARRSIEQTADMDLEQVLRDRAVWEFAKQQFSKLPRETVRRRYMEAERPESSDSSSMVLLQFMAFDKIVDGESIDSILKVNAPDAESTDDDESSTNDAEGESSALPEEFKSFCTNLVDQTVRSFAVQLALEGLIEHRKIEADSEWIEEQIRSAVDRIQLMSTDDDTQQYLDHVYSDENYQRLVSQSLVEQGVKTLMNEITIHEETQDVEEYFESTGQVEDERALNVFPLSDSLPDPEPFVADERNGDDATGEVDAEADTVTSSDREISDSNDETHEKPKKVGFFKKLFQKNEPPQE